MVVRSLASSSRATHGPGTWRLSVTTRGTWHNTSASVIAPTREGHCQWQRVPRSTDALAVPCLDWATGWGTAIDGAVGLSRPRANRSVGCLAVSQGVVRIGRSPGGFRVLPVYAGLRPVVCDVTPAQVGQPVVQLRGAVVSGGVPAPFLGSAAPVLLHLPVRPLFESLHSSLAFGVRVGVHAYRSFA